MLDISISKTMHYFNTCMYLINLYSNLYLPLLTPLNTSNIQLNFYTVPHIFIYITVEALIIQLTLHWIINSVKIRRVSLGYHTIVVLDHLVSVFLEGYLPIATRTTFVTSDIFLLFLAYSVPRSSAWNYVVNSFLSVYVSHPYASTDRMHWSNAFFLRCWGILELETEDSSQLNRNE